MQRLFVYGTLVPGGPNEHVLAGLGGEWEPAAVQGRLVQEGWGAQEGYPGLVLDRYGTEVEGFLLSSDELDGGWWLSLDDFEGAGYERVRAAVRKRDGASVEAYVYALRRE